MSKLVDLFIEWAKRKQRWPLLLMFLVPVWFAFFQKFYGLTFRQVFDNRLFLLLSASTIAVSAIGYVLLTSYERIIYSRTLARVRRRRRAIVTAPLAWQRLTYQDGTGDAISVTIVSEIARMLDGLGVHPVVVPEQVDPRAPAGPGDEFAIYGVVSPTGTLLKSVVLLPNPDQALRFVRRLQEGFDAEQPRVRERAMDADLRPAVIADRDVPGPDLDSSSVAPDERTALTRMFLRNALMTMLYRDGHAAGSSLPKHCRPRDPLPVPKARRWRRFTRQ